MHVVICLDERDGISFNNRRLSSDKAVYQRIFAQHSGKLWMNSYSAKLFAEMDVCVNDAFLNHAAAEDTCFVESLDFVDFLPHTVSITVYRWNRHYPSDVKFPQSLLKSWTLKEQKDFAGNSHEIITEERYVK